MNCDNCKYCKIVTIEDKFGKRYEFECNAPFDDMPRECAIELDMLKEWENER